MSGEIFRDIVAFITIARERSFTRAAAELGVSQSALSHTIRNLEARLGLRLLIRTTRSVSPTEAGLRLLERVSPRFDVIADELASLSELGSKIAGTVRISGWAVATGCPFRATERVPGDGPRTRFLCAAELSCPGWPSHRSGLDGHVGISNAGTTRRLVRHADVTTRVDTHCR